MRQHASTNSVVANVTGSEQEWECEMLTLRKTQQQRSSSSSSSSSSSGGGGGAGRGGEKLGVRWCTTAQIRTLRHTAATDHRVVTATYRLRGRLPALGGHRAPHERKSPSQASCQARCSAGRPALRPSAAGARRKPTVRFVKGSTDEFIVAHVFWSEGDGAERPQTHDGRRQSETQRVPSSTLLWHDNP